MNTKVASRNKGPSVVLLPTEDVQLTLRRHPADSHRRLSRLVTHGLIDFDRLLLIWLWCIFLTLVVPSH